MNPKLSSALAWARRYLSLTTLVVIGALFYIVLSGESAVVDTIAYERKIDSLEVLIEAERDTLLYYQSLNQRLNSDPELMETVVREQYGMKRATEDVYLVKPIKK